MFDEKLKCVFKSFYVKLFSFTVKLRIQIRFFLDPDPGLVCDNSRIFKSLSKKIQDMHFFRQFLTFNI